MANAGRHLRTNETSKECSSGSIGPGLDSYLLESKHGVIPTGDLSTVICSYDATAGKSYNLISLLTTFC